MSAPVKHTCPLIDSVISDIHDRIDTLKIAMKHFECGEEHPSREYVEQAIIDLESMVPMRSSTFSSFFNIDHLEIEQIRNANQALRSWGEDLEIELQDAHKEIDVLTEERDHLLFQLNQKQS